MAQRSQTVADYQKRLKAAGKYAEDRLTKRADRMVNLYQVNHYYRDAPGGSAAEYAKEEGDRSKVPYPYANSRQILAEILPFDPQPVVKVESKAMAPDPAAMGQEMLGAAERMDPAEGAKMMKGAIQYVVRKSNFRREEKMAILDSIVTGIGVVQLVAQTSTLVPKFKRLTYRNVLLDWGAVTDPYQSDFVAVKETRRLDLIKNDDALREAARKDVRAVKLDPALYGDTDIDYGVLWHVYDKREDAYLCFSDGQEFELQKGNITLSELYGIPSFEDGFKCDWPFAVTVNEEMLSEAWGMGDVFPIESQVRALDKLRTRQILHTKRFNRKYVAEKGTLGTDGKNQLKSPEDGSLIEVAKGVNPTTAVFPLQDAPLSGDQYKVEEAVKEDLQVIQPIGPNSLVRGIGQQPDTLGQSEIIEQNANNRLGEKQKNVAAFIARLFTLSAYYVRKYWTFEQELLASGDGTRDDDWLRFDPKFAKGQFEYDVAPESLKDNTQVYRNQMQAALATLAPLMPVISTGQAPGLALICRRYVESFETLSKEADKIIPEAWTQPMQPMGLSGQGGAQTPEDQEILDLVGNTDPDELIDSINAMPENERTALTDRIAVLTQGAGANFQPQEPTNA